MSEIFAVHAVRPSEVRPTELICGTLADAERYAAELSKDPGVLAAGITRFVLDELGTRQAVALYVAGVKQQVPYVSDDRAVHANGTGHTLPLRHRP
jgi:hypothetical protein